MSNMADILKGTWAAYPSRVSIVFCFASVVFGFCLVWLSAATVVLGCLVWLSAATVVLECPFLIVSLDNTHVYLIPTFTRCNQTTQPCTYHKAPLLSQLLFINLLSSLKMFWWKLFLFIIPNKVLLFKWKIVGNSLCNFSKLDEAYSHYCITCAFLKEFWTKFQNSMKDLGIEAKITLKHIVLEYKSSIKTILHEFFW
jgi:hypothetical protein